MRFIDGNIRLNINGLSFKAYLEDSDIMYETKDVSLPFAPTSFTNDKMATRLMQRAKFTFNVFSESRGECVQNYNNLLKLIYSIKPTFEYIDDQLAPLGKNITGIVKLSFIGMPLASNIVNLHLNSFNYTINKELGYIEIPNKEIKDSTNAAFYDSKGMKLIPLAYKISMEGRILLPFEQTVRQIGGPAKNKQIDYEQFKKNVFDKKADDREHVGATLSAFTAITGRNPSEYSQEKGEDMLKKISKLVEDKVIDGNGNFIGSGVTAGEAETMSLDQQTQEQYNNYTSTVAAIKKEPQEAQ